VINTYVGHAADLLAWFGEIWHSLVDVVGRAIGGVRDALAAGDIEAAMKVAVTGLQLVWSRGVNGLAAAWYGFKDGVLDAASDMWTKLLKGGVAAVQGLQAAYAILAGVIGRTMMSASNSVALSWGRLRAKFDDDFDVNEYESILQANYQADINQSKARQDAELAGIGATYEATIVGLDADRDADRTQRDQARQDELDQLSAKRAAAELEFNQAIQAAADARAKAEADRPDPEPPAKAEFPDVQKQMQALMDQAQLGAAQAQQTETKTAALGGFNAAAFDRLFGRATKDQHAADTADATAEAAKLLRRYLPLLRQTAGVFS
jgi:hypothetical protein